VDKDAYVAACRNKHDTLDRKKSQYWTERIMAESSSPRKLWRSMAGILQREGRIADNITLTSNDADAFLSFFEEKVKAVHDGAEGQPPPVSASTVHTSLSLLLPCTVEEIRRFIMLSPTKSCALDPIPKFLLKEMVDVLLPYVTAMVNASLHEGRLPSLQKHAVILPLLKKPGLNADDPKNYRQPHLHIEAGGAGCIITAHRLSGRTLLNASASVSLQAPSLHRDRIAEGSVGYLYGH
jgi:hypothetical protein